MADPAYVINLLRRGVAFHQVGNLADAQKCYERVLKAEPRNVDANHLLGIIKGQQGDGTRALQLIEVAVKQAPHSPVIQMNHGNALKALGRCREAITAYDRALALQSANADAWINRGTALNALGRHVDAIASYDRAIALNRQSFPAWYNRGNALKAVRRHEDAADSYRRALAIDRRHADAHFQLGLALMAADPAEAVVSFDRALALDPGLADARAARCVAALPPLFEREVDIARCRAAYIAELDRLEAEVNRLSNVYVAPFYLAYQGMNDREPQQRFGRLLCRLLSALNPAPERLARPPAPGEPIRVGFVADQFYLHSVWKIPLKGWLTQLDRSSFRLFGYHTSGMGDAETEVARELCERFVQGPKSLEGMRDEILADRPHVLIYPEIGMDPAAAALAALRLAPVQCTSLGHPNTTGYPTMDYFLTSDAMEAQDAAEHYSERLVRLPNLGVYYEPTPLGSPHITRQELGLRGDACVYWCA
jgi:predicted O-linked N-acetylglucosamine transferase (SPINDLY family)